MIKCTPCGEKCLLNKMCEIKDLNDELRLLDDKKGP